MGQPWERLPDENDLAWAAFKAYRDQQVPRNIRRAASKDENLTVAMCISFYGEHNWKERCLAYDKYVDEVLLAERLEYLKQDARARTAEHLVLLKDAREVVACEMRKLLAWAENTPETNVMAPSNIAKMLDTVVKLERLVAGESTENTNTKTEIDFSGLSADELRLVGPALEKAGILSLTNSKGSATKS